MFIPLAEADTETCGAKAAALGALLRAGLRVPDGFVVPFAVYRATAGAALRCRQVPGQVLDALDRALEHLDVPAVAVRSSALDEDGPGGSAAGQYDSFLAVHGLTAVADALRACWASLYAPRAVDYRRHDHLETSDTAAPAMAVIVQTHLDAAISGALFTPPEADDPTTVEAAWGLGPSVVAGTVTPDSYRIHADGTITRTVADKRTRLDRVGTRLLVRDVHPDRRAHATLDDTAATELARLGAATATVLGGPQDLEWAIADGRTWLLQARPITATAPSHTPPPGPASSTGTLTGTPSSHGTVTGTARTVRGPGDFARVHPGDILLCPFTDPAWTPLLRIAAGVVTETGGALSHAAIIARERRIPAVTGVTDVLASVPDGATLTIDGTTGTVRIHPTPTGSRVGGHT